MAVEVEARGVAEKVRKVHDPLVDLHHLWLRCRLLLLQSSWQLLSVTQPEPSVRRRRAQGGSALGIAMVEAVCH